MIALNFFIIVLAFMFLGWTSWFAWELTAWQNIVLYAAPVLAGVHLFNHFRSRRVAQSVLKLGKFTWSMGDFCRGWLITGATGSGKTLAAVKRMLWQVSLHQPEWGGLCLDEKGLFWETLTEMFHHHPQKSVDDLILLEVRPENAAPDWRPRYTYNFLDAPGIPFSNHAKTIVDVATSLQKKGAENPFFPQQAILHLEWGFRALKEANLPITLKQCYEVLTNHDRLEFVLGLLREKPTDEAFGIVEHFHANLLNLPEETKKGIIATIAGYLSAFTHSAIAEVFCPEEPATFDFRQIDQGKVVCVAIPQKYAVERTYINTLLKLNFYRHALRRFDEPASGRRQHNLLICWADEFQKLATASEAGLSDYNSVDTIREAKATVVACTQSITSLTPPMGSQTKANVFVANMTNRITFKAADEDSAKVAADTIGQREQWKKSYGVSGGKRSFNRHKEDRHIIPPHKFRQLKKFQCILQHTERGWQKLTLPPLANDGKVPEWWRG